MKTPNYRLGLLVLLCLVHWVSCRSVHFELNLTWEDRRVAGVVRKAILSNGELPGPTLRVHQGDEVEVRVRNWMPFSTTVHFHGMFKAKKKFSIFDALKLMLTV